jgi:hypothetical protein
VREGQKGRQSRKRQADLEAVNTLESGREMDVAFGLRQVTGEAHEGIRCDEQRAASREKPLEVMKPRRAAAPGTGESWCSRVANPRGEQSLEGDARMLKGRMGLPVSIQEAPRQRHGGDRSREGPKALRGEKALKGKAQERCRHEIRPDGRERSKPSGGLGTLKTEGVG